MTTWRWIDRTVLFAIHDMQLAEHGGGAGLRDGKLLESNLAKPENLAACGDPDAAALAAQPTVKAFRATMRSLMATGATHSFSRAFLQLNGRRIEVDDADCVLTMLAVATGDITEDAFADWLRLHAHKK